MFCTHVLWILLIQRLLKLHPDKALFNLGLLSRLFRLKCGELFWKVGCYLCWKGFLLTFLPLEMRRGGFRGRSRAGQMSLSLRGGEQHGRTVAENFRVLLLGKLPVWVTCLLLLTFHPVTLLDFPFSSHQISNHVISNPHSCIDQITAGTFLCPSWVTYFGFLCENLIDVFR